MHVDSEPIWGTYAQTLNDTLAIVPLREDEYFNKYKISTDNPLAAVEPKDLKFFGPQMLNILIASKPYGWTFDTGTSLNVFSWPPEGMTDSLAKIRAAFPQWNEYKLLIYGDRSLAATLAESELNDMLTTTFGQLQTMCIDNADIGFVWKGEIASLPDPTFFNSVLDEHYGRV